MKIITTTLILASAVAVANDNVPTGIYKDSTLAWGNSALNFSNSTLDYRNSPLNWANSPLNIFSERGVYDTDGVRQGYAVPKLDGATNFFSDDGEPTGYQPSPIADPFLSTD